MASNESFSHMHSTTESEGYLMLNNETAASKGEVSPDEASYFHLDIRERHDEMAQWSQERLATFFEAVSVLMSAKTQSRMPSRPALTGADANGRSANLDVVEQRIKRIEQNVDGVRRHVATLHESIAEDFKAFEENLASQSTVIQSTKTAMSQTDDLVERVVEALEVLQTSSFTPDEAIAAAVN